MKLSCVMAGRTADAVCGIMLTATGQGLPAFRGRLAQKTEAISGDARTNGQTDKKDRDTQHHGKSRQDRQRVALLAKQLQKCRSGRHGRNMLGKMWRVE